MIKTLLKKILPNPYKGAYYIGFVQKDKIVPNVNSWYGSVKWINTSRFDKEGWFADPFFYDVTDTHIFLFAEEMYYAIGHGRLVLMKIRRSDYFLEEIQPILTLDTHLSFPIIWKENDRLYVYPENEQSGKLNIYEFNQKSQTLITPPQRS